MLNAERFKEEINKHNNEFGLTDSIADCKTLECRNCRFSRLNNSDDEIILCSTRKVKWLLSEYKEPIKLSRLEYEILKWAKKEGYKYITRDEDCELCTFQSEPEKLNIAWDCCDVYIELPLFKKLFQFIQWADEKPTSIQEMLNNCEVIDGESE
jgi:hypothetical protein